MTSQAANKQLKDTLPNNSMKFGQVTKYNMRKIFLENHTQNAVEKLFPDHFLKNQN